MAEPSISGSSGSDRPIPVATGMKFSVDGVNAATSDIKALSGAVRELQTTVMSMGSQNTMMMQGMNSVFSNMQQGASSTAQALNSGGGRGGGTTGSGIPYNYGGAGGGLTGGGTDAFSGVFSNLKGENLTETMFNVASVAPKYAYNRMEETRQNAPAIAGGLGPLATLNSTKISRLIEQLQEGTPVLGDLGNTIGALNEGAMSGYGQLGSAKSGAYFEGIRQMQLFTPSVGAAGLAKMSSDFLGNTGGHQKALMLTGGAMSGFGAGGVPKTLQEWAESTLKWFEGQRPGGDRGKSFTKEELATQQFPGSNMDAWFSTTDVPEYMRQYFWQYVIGKASTGSSDIAVIIGERGQDLARERLRTQSAQGRRDFQVLGSSSNYEQFANREGQDRKFESMMGQIDQKLTGLMGDFLGPLMSALPTPLANMMVATFFKVGAQAAAATGNVASKVPGLGFLGDTPSPYGEYGGQGLAHLDPSFASKVSNMMAANPNISITSGYRDGITQGKLYDAGVGNVGHPNDSMHTKGLAADLGPESEMGWIAANAASFGLDSGSRFGEPWHVGAPGTIPIGDPINPSGGTPSWLTNLTSGNGSAPGFGSLPAVGPPAPTSKPPGSSLWGRLPGMSSTSPFAGATASGDANSGDDPSLFSQMLGGISDVAGGIVSSIPGMDALASFAQSALGVFDTIGNLFQGAKQLASGDFSALFGKGGLMDPSALIDNFADGFGKVTGLPIAEMLKGGDAAVNAFAGFLGGSSGIRKPGVASSVDFSKKRGSGATDGAPATADGVMGTPGSSAGAAAILQKYNNGVQVNSESIGNEAGALEALKAASAAGFSGDELVVIASIAGRESGWKADAHRTTANRSSVSGDRGMWQINYVHDPRLAQNGIISANNAAGKRELFDVNVNARAAMDVYKNNGSTFNAWKASAGGFNPSGSPLYGASKYIEPIYNLAKSNGFFIGDPRKKQAVSNQESPTYYAPQMSTSNNSNTYATQSNNTVNSSPITMENTFNLQISGNDTDAKRAAYIISDHLRSAIEENSYLGV